MHRPPTTQELDVIEHEVVRAAAHAMKLYSPPINHEVITNLRAAGVNQDYLIAAKYFMHDLRAMRVEDFAGRVVTGIANGQAAGIEGVMTMPLPEKVGLLSKIINLFLHVGGPTRRPLPHGSVLCSAAIQGCRPVVLPPGKQ